MGGEGLFLPRRAMIRTGTYTGNGIDDRTINIGVNLAAKANVFILIFGVNHVALCRIEYAQGDLTMYYTNDVDLVNAIQSFAATGFVIGTQASVNADTLVYRYIVFWEEP